jgi:putative component of toxin-antitoxin plasmid stabilization module
MRIVYFVDHDGTKPFAKWCTTLDPAATVRVARLLERLEDGNLASPKSVGSGVHEARID